MLRRHRKRKAQATNTRTGVETPHSSREAITRTQTQYGTKTMYLFLSTGYYQLLLLLLLLLMVVVYPCGTRHAAHAQGPMRSPLESWGDHSAIFLLAHWYITVWP